jgi:hypothetical protein
VLVIELMSSVRRDVPMRDFFRLGAVQAVADRRVRELWWEGSFGNKHRIDTTWVVCWLLTAGS